MLQTQPHAQPCFFDRAGCMDVCRQHAVSARSCSSSKMHESPLLATAASMTLSLFSRSLYKRMTRGQSFRKGCKSTSPLASMTLDKSGRSSTWRQPATPWGNYTRPFATRRKALSTWTCCKMRGHIQAQSASLITCLASIITSSTVLSHLFRQARP
jgi:hypothetical protein